MKEEILEAKCKLYLLLMELDVNTITDNESDIMFLLSKDEQIRSLFKAHMKKLQSNTDDDIDSNCLIVTCLPCKTPFIGKESPEGCCECGMLDWLCFDTEQEANEAFKKQNPEQFDSEGKYIGI